MGRMAKGGGPKCIIPLLFAPTAVAETEVCANVPETEVCANACTGNSATTANIARQRVISTSARSLAESGSHGNPQWTGPQPV